MNKRILFALCLALVSIVMLYGCMDRSTNDALDGAGAPGSGADAGGDGTSSPSETTGNAPEETVTSENTEAPAAEAAGDVTDDPNIPDDVKNNVVDAYKDFFSKNVYSIGRYFGDFNGVSAVIVYEDGKTYTDAEWSETVDGVVFTYRDGNRLMAFDGKSFYTLQEAFEKGLLTHDDLVTIASGIKVPSASAATTR